MSPPPGAVMAAKLTSVSALGFVPVVVHFKLFETLVNHGRAASAAEILEANNAERSEEEKAASPLCLRLVEDTLFIMAGQSFVDLVSDNIFAPNALTQHWVSLPSASHGALHFTTEALLASAFVMPQLLATNFAYPFADAHTPHQFAHAQLGHPELANSHTYAIMEQQGRLPSFNAFMAGKFGRFGAMPARVAAFGYDLGAALAPRPDAPIAMVDVGGGTGEMLREVLAAFPDIPPASLVVQEFQADLGPLEGGIALQAWDFKAAAQPVRGARVYSLTHILHNNSDVEAARLLGKLEAAMEGYSRVLVHEFSKGVAYGNMHAAMVGMYAGRVRSAREWRVLAKGAGLEVTFETYPESGEGLVEMRKVGWREAEAEAEGK